MDINRPLVRMAALSAAGAMVLAAAPAMARAPKPAPPGSATNPLINASGITVSNGTYGVPSTWGARTRNRQQISSFEVLLKNATTGTLLDRDTVPASTHSWTSETTAPAGTNVVVTVTAFNSTKKGGSSTSPAVQLPDMTAPTGTFKVSVDKTDNRTVTVTPTVSDDLSPASEVSGYVDWGDEALTGADADTSPTQTLTSMDQPFTHVYPAVQGRWLPTIVLTDKAGNATDALALPAAVILDTNAPTGAAYTAAPGSAWASFTDVVLTETSAPADQFSPVQDITRVVDWGDGSAPEPWAGTTMVHRYAATADSADTYTPVVTVTDEAGNAVDVSSNAVTVTKDSTAPVVKFKYPAKPRNVVKKWRTLRGSVADAGVGAKRVQLVVIEKRGRAWYAYKPGTHRWVKAGTMHRAWTKAGISRMTPSSTGAWAKSVVGLRRGTLTYRAKGVDRVNNTSRWLTHSQTLTR